MTGCKSVRLSGAIRVPLPPQEAFILFIPSGERAWADDWDPQFLTEPGEGPKLHWHPYAEVFVVEQGQATFQLCDRQLIVPSGHVVVGPPNTPHGFANSGPGELQLVSIHEASVSIRVAGWSRSRLEFASAPSH